MTQEIGSVENVTRLQETINQNDGQGMTSMGIARDSLGRSVLEIAFGMPVISVGVAKLFEGRFIDAGVAFLIGGLVTNFGVRDSIEGFYHFRKSYDLLNSSRNMRDALSRKLESLK